MFLSKYSSSSDKILVRLESVKTSGTCEWYAVLSIDSTTSLEEFMKKLPLAVCLLETKLLNQPYLFSSTEPEDSSSTENSPLTLDAVTVEKFHNKAKVSASGMYLSLRPFGCVPL